MAQYTDETITVYQAYSDQIADAALKAGTFVPPFKRDRMTWIKPSFTWMAYRSGWGTKPLQERILAIDITREGFEWALANASLSHFDSSTHPNRDSWKAQLHSSPVRVQWDPERTVTLEPGGERAIQVGLSAEAVVRYVDDWIVRISDVSRLTREIHEEVTSGSLIKAQNMLPKENYYPLPPDIRSRIGADD